MSSGMKHQPIFPTEGSPITSEGTELTDAPGLDQLEDLLEEIVRLLATQAAASAIAQLSKK